MFHSQISLKRNKTLFSFFNTEEAKQHNAKILRDYDMKITKAIKAQPYSMVSFGSEFREPSELEALLFKHSNWPALRDILENGVSREISKCAR
jgi:hypothetical protein